MRTHALYNRDKRILTLTLGTGLIILGISGVCWFDECNCFSWLIGASKWSLTGQKSTPQTDVPGCNNARPLEKWVFMSFPSSIGGLTGISQTPAASVRSFVYPLHLELWLKVIWLQADLAIPWECIFLFDSMIFTLTIIKTFKSSKNPSNVTLQYSGELPISALVFRDGAIQYW